MKIKDAIGLIVVVAVIFFALEWTAIRHQTLILTPTACAAFRALGGATEILDGSCKVSGEVRTTFSKVSTAAPCEDVAYAFRNRLKQHVWDGTGFPVPFT